LGAFIGQLAAVIKAEVLQIAPAGPGHLPPRCRVDQVLRQSLRVRKPTQARGRTWPRVLSRTVTAQHRDSRLSDPGRRLSHDPALPLSAGRSRSLPDAPASD
jgi:hypothetical protein